MMIALKIVLLIVLLGASLIAALQAFLAFLTHEFSPDHGAANAAAKRWGYGIAAGWLGWIVFAIGW